MIAVILRMGHWSSNRWFAAGLVISTMVLIVNGVVSRRALGQVLNIRKQAQASSEAINSAERLLSSLKDAETGQRGYLLTGDETYLAPYRDALARVQNDIQSYSRSSGDQAEADAVQSHIRNKLAELQRTIELRRDRGAAAALSVVKTDVGQLEMDIIRTLLTGGQARERQRASALYSMENHSIQVANLTFVIANGIVLLLFCGIIWLLVRQAKQLELTVTLRTASLKEAKEDLETFLYSVSHDLRAPLRSMQGLAQAVLEDYPDKLDETGRDYLQRIADAGKRMSGLIQDLLAFSRLSRPEITEEQVELGPLVGEAIRQLRDESGSYDVEVDIPASLPPVVAHESILQMVIKNLLSNAQKFVKPGQRAEIQVYAESLGKTVRLWICDKGIGIAPKHQQQIFDVFERLHSNEVYPGSGLGLAIVKRGVERMKGTFGLESKEMEGSKFWIELPAGHQRTVHPREKPKQPTSWTGN